MGSVMRMRITPVAVTPMDWPRSPMPRSNQKRPMMRGVNHRNRTRLTRMPPTERTRNAPRFSPTALIETVAMAEMTRKSRAQPWMRSIICGSMTWETPSAFAISWRITPPISAMGNRGT